MRRQSVLLLAALGFMACTETSPRLPPETIVPADADLVQAEVDAELADDAPDDSGGCGLGRVECGGRCVDLGSDAAHCGACGRACGDGELCSAAACLCLGAPGVQARACEPAEGEVCCPGIGCVELDRNPHACGSCSARCNPGEQCLGGACSCGSGLGCAQGSVCCGAQCCPAGELCCEGACAAPGSELCQCGALSACAAIESCCADAAGAEACIDTSSSAGHCGGCGSACGEQQLCVLGSCDCSPGYGDCDDGLGCETELATDRAHCGSCANACDADERCEGGECVCGGDAVCAFGYVCCGTSCVDGAQSPNCGACGNDCGAQPSDHACVPDDAGGYACGCGVDGDCGSDEHCCGGRCVSLAQSPNCGACGVDCSERESGRACVSSSTQWSCGCADDADCTQGERCAEGACVACTPNWTPTGGGEHCNYDWVLEATTVVGGNHSQVGLFRIAEGVTVTVQPLDSDGTGTGRFELAAARIELAGTLEASGAGYRGGPGGGGAGSGVRYCGAPGGAGSAGQGGAAGGGGAAGPAHGGNDNDDPGCRYANGGGGGSGGPGGYAVSGGNGDTSEDREVALGSGGGGGGGGGAGSRYGSNNNFPAGTGGGGGAGGRGGGAVRLRSASTFLLSGSVRARGALAGNGGNGGKLNPCNDRYANAPGGGGGNADAGGSSGGGAGTRADVTCGGDGVSNTSGGNGGNGGGGAGGGVLLEAQTLTISGSVDASGANANNGGTVKLFACTLELLGTVSAGRRFDSSAGCGP